MNRKLIPLPYLSEDRVGIVRLIYGGQGITRRLAELGISPNTLVRKLNGWGGPVVISVRGSKIALSRGIAMKILVEEIN